MRGVVSIDTIHFATADFNGAIKIFRFFEGNQSELIMRYDFQNTKIYHLKYENGFFVVALEERQGLES